MIRNIVIRYESWCAYNCETVEEAITQFKQDGHENDEIISVEGGDW